MATVFEFDVEGFRLQFPAFSDDTTYPDLTLEGYWDMAIEYISDVNYGYLRDGSRYLALNLMTAHLAALFTLINAGETPGQIQGATIDKVSVTLTPPPNKNQFDWWLGLTPYGAQLLALLQMKSVGGFYVVGCRGARGLV
jgi:hypothetical protein